MCLTFDKKVVHFFGILKKERNYTKYLCLLSHKSFPNLGAQTRCGQNGYTAVQTDLKYPLKLQPSVLCVFKMQKIYKIRSTVVSFFVEADANMFTTE